MEITIKEFYPDPKKIGKKVFGALHVVVSVGGIEFDLRGVLAAQQNDGNFFVKFPCRQGVDHRTGRSIFYTTFKFVDQEMNEKLIKLIADEALDFIKSWLESRNEAKADVSDVAIEVKSQSISHESVMPPLKGSFKAGQIYRDPPKRSAPLMRGRK